MSYLKAKSASEDADGKLVTGLLGLIGTVALALTGAGLLLSLASTAYSLDK